MASEKQSLSKQAYRDYINVTRMLIEFYTDTGRSLDTEGRLYAYDEFRERIRQEADFANRRVEASRSRDKPLWTARIDDRITYALDEMAAIYDAMDEEPDDEDEDDELERLAAEFGTDVDTYIILLDTGVPHGVSQTPHDNERYKPYPDLMELLNDVYHFISYMEFIRYDGTGYYVSIRDSGKKSRRARR